MPVHCQSTGPASEPAAWQYHRDWSSLSRVSEALSGLPFSVRRPGPGPGPGRAATQAGTVTVAQAQVRSPSQAWLYRTG